MTIKEYEDMDLPVDWGIMLYDYPPDTDREDMELDVRSTAPDGTYDIVMRNHNPFNSYVKENGVVVKGSEFDLSPTTETIDKLIKKCNEDSVYPMGVAVQEDNGETKERKQTVTGIWYNPIGKYFRLEVNHY